MDSDEYGNEADAEYLIEKINEIYDLFLEESKGNEERAIASIKHVKTFIFKETSLSSDFPGNAIKKVTDLKEQIQGYPEFINTAEEILNEFIEEVSG